MEAGRIDVSALAGGFDLQATLESGQSYLWQRADGRMYDGDEQSGGDAWYETVVRVDDDRIRLDAGDPVVVRVRQRDGALEWESTTDADWIVRSLLRLEDDLPAIRAATPDDRLLDAAFDRYWGMRLVRDPPFGTLISFICSAQMRVSRIHEMQLAMAEAFGDTVAVDGRTYRVFPTPDQLAAATESELRDLGLGYRAPYVQRTAEMVASGEAHPDDARDRAYEDAREHLTQFVGVGQKVADCVLLFSLDFLEAVPLDTWIQTTIEEYYPDCDRDSYAATSRAIRERLGGEYAGYAQTYVFHHLRSES
ncbi:DNA-3-methyladenine glycosylase family protein [Halapricum hydrolyticum]|uniref:DNA-(apurinic or apyrimidinic site) lyase n=1 Tax=Halapricum hydrolyticum TaxID=2979991 RepID=A0AAE3LI45_9EURY|nr:DNA glycosylase [Halapricum hydrolyticum]MCU4716497.1 8-oxoguanine DNA glycosylase [Halapricum hydrolyticum]MCU4725898.1 8-oxoguanine DNA glycosylase [Halapricum hydrolyticum]